MLRASVIGLVIAGCVLTQACGGRRAWEHPLIVKQLQALDGVVVESAIVADGNLGYTVAHLRVREKGALVAW